MNKKRTTAAVLIISLVILLGSCGYLAKGCWINHFAASYSGFSDFAGTRASIDAGDTEPADGTGIGPIFC